jgi:hypothetical protein
MYATGEPRTAAVSRRVPVFSNRNGDRVNIPPSVTVILLDLLNTAFDD